MSRSNKNENSVDVTIGRRPVYDKRRRLWGYELFCIGDAATPSGFPREDGVAVQVAASAYIGLQQIIKREKKIVINFSEKSILNNLPYAFPPILAVVKVDESDLGIKTLPDMLRKLKKDGYQIAVKGYSGLTDQQTLFSLADILWLDVHGLNKQELMLKTKTVVAPDTQMMAARVEDRDHFDMCLDLGFSLFEGPFFKSAEIITMRKLSSNEVSRFNLLKAIQTDTPDLEALAETIQSDASISFRLLAYLNSAAFGFPQKVKSIQHALSLLGWRKIKNWLRVILLADVDHGGDSGELFSLAAQRGKFLELICEIHDYWGFDPESLHLLGLFSLLDAMLGIPMEEIVTFLPLDNKIKAALCREANNEYLPLLQVAHCFEEGMWPEADTLMHQLNLDIVKTKNAFKTALNWAAELTSLQSGQAGSAPP